MSFQLTHYPESDPNQSLRIVQIKAIPGHDLDIQLTLVVSNSVDSNFRLSRIFIEVPNFVVYKYI
jgi:hypothetical protein